MEDDSLAVTSLDDSHRDEVLAFLNQRPRHTFMMGGLIRDNGLESPLNRGTFYACRDQRGTLAGVSLIGEITMVEAHTDAALKTLARRTQGVPNIYMIIGEQGQTSHFWDYYAEAGREMRLFCRELLFELRYPVEVHPPVPGMRQATLDELEPLMAVHAQMALAESGVNPLEVDPEGFRRRCTRRIEQGRTWAYVKEGRLVFKADVVSETPEVTYLEGVYVSPGERGHGYGVRCLSQLSQHLLPHAKSICVLVNERNQAAQALYRKARYKLDGIYDTVFLH
ncbi:MAG: GNAT family N-acetyltransferase [Acidobacteria bacterium]|nr:GNAT family N-acetyltransferase [Acidobacteriota bacterium]